MLGSHLSIAGSMTRALDEARELGLDTVQVFTKNQQQWKAPPLKDDAVREWSAAVRDLGWDSAPAGSATDAKGSPGRLVAHASYLINLASPDDELWQKSIDLMRVEIERCEALGIPFLVHHPGSPTGAGVEFGIARIAAAYKALFGQTRGFRTVSCLENTVGAGSTLGGPFEELAELRRRIIDATGEPSRVGFCVDTCHAHAAGHDMGTRAAGDATLEALGRICGFGNVKVVHVNDSKGKLGSRRDLHQHIGEGELTRQGVADSGFAAVMNRAELAGVPKILETPKGADPSGTPYDTLNLRRLRELMRSGKPIDSRPKVAARGGTRKSRASSSSPEGGSASRPSRARQPRS